jgi:integrase
MVHHARVRLETLHVRMNTIAHYHREGNHPTPVDDSVRAYLSYARRERKEEPRGRAALTYDHLRRIALDFLSSESPIAIRDRAMILLGFASGWRRSELVSLRLSDISFVPKGVELWLRFSKTDQAGEGRIVGIEAGRKSLTCPVRALRSWLNVRGSWEGPLFVR